MAPDGVTQCNLNPSVKSTVRNSPLGPLEKVRHLAALVHGLTVAEYCAQRLGKTRYHVHQVLTCKRPSHGLVERIAADLGVSTEDLMPDQTPNGSLWPA